MSATQKWACWLTSLTAAVWLGVAVAQPPKKDDKKKEEPPTKEELALRQGSKDLAYKFKTGEEIHCEARNKRTEHRMIQDKKTQDVQDVVLKLVMTVDSVQPNGTAAISARVDQVVFNRSGRVFKKFDNHKPGSQQDAEGWELFVDARFKFNVDLRGIVSNIRPDAETAEFWKQQHKQLRSLVSDDAIRSMLPYVKLPTDLARVGTDWKVTNTFLDETFGRRDVTIELSYRGNETISGQTLEYIRLRGEGKLQDPKPKYEIVEQTGEGSARFDLTRGHLRHLRYVETYLYNPPGAPLVDAEKESSNAGGKAPKGGRFGSGSSSSAGGSYPGGGRGKGAKPKKDDKEKKVEDKSITMEHEYDYRVTYRGKPISGQ